MEQEQNIKSEVFTQSTMIIIKSVFKKTVIIAAQFTQKLLILAFQGLKIIASHGEEFVQEPSVKINQIRDSIHSFLNEDEFEQNMKEFEIDEDIELYDDDQEIEISQKVVIAQNQELYDQSKGNQINEQNQKEDMGLPLQEQENQAPQISKPLLLIDSSSDLNNLPQMLSNQQQIQKESIKEQSHKNMDQ